MEGGQQNALKSTLVEPVEAAVMGQPVADGLTVTTVEPTMQQVRPEVPGVWSSGLCSCCDDCCICCSVCWLPWIPVAQLIDRFSPFTPGGRKYRCVHVAIFLFIMGLISQIMAQVANAQLQEAAAKLWAKVLQCGTDPQCINDVDWSSLDAYAPALSACPIPRYRICQPSLLKRGAPCPRPRAAHLPRGRARRHRVAHRRGSLHHQLLHHRIRPLKDPQRTQDPAVVLWQQRGLLLRLLVLAVHAVPDLAPHRRARSRWLDVAL